MATQRRTIKVRFWESLARYVTLWRCGWCEGRITRSERNPEDSVLCSFNPAQWPVPCIAGWTRTGYPILAEHAECHAHRWIAMMRERQVAAWTQQNADQAAVQQLIWSLTS